MRVAFATCSLVADGWPDDREAASLLDADFRSWDDAGVDWGRYDRVVLRSVFTYQHHVDEFLGWCRAVGPERLRNSPDLVSFSSDKRYLSELSAPTIPTAFIGPGDPLPELRGEVVVKPNISAGARDTGRFSRPAHDEALALIDRIRAKGRVALVQPYMANVDRDAETAFVFFGGELSHVLRKRAVLRPDEVAPVAREGFPQRSASHRPCSRRISSPPAKRARRSTSWLNEFSTRWSRASVCPCSSASTSSATTPTRRS